MRRNACTRSVSLSPLRAEQRKREGKRASASKLERAEEEEGICIRMCAGDAAAHRQRLRGRRRKQMSNTCAFVLILLVVVLSSAVTQTLALDWSGFDDDEDYSYAHQRENGGGKEKEKEGDGHGGNDKPAVGRMDDVTRTLYPFLDAIETTPLQAALARHRSVMMEEQQQHSEEKARSRDGIEEGESNAGETRGATKVPHGEHRSTDEESNETVNYPPKLHVPTKTKMSVRRRRRRGLSSFPFEAVTALEDALFAHDGTSETFRNATAALAANCTLLEQPPELVRCLHRAGRGVYSHDLAAINCVTRVIDVLDEEGFLHFEYRVGESDHLEDINKESPDASLLFYKGIFELTGIGAPMIPLAHETGIQSLLHSAFIGSWRATMALATWSFALGDGSGISWGMRSMLAVRLMSIVSSYIIENTMPMEVDGLPNTLRQRERGVAMTRAEAVNSMEQVDFERDLASHGDSDAQVDLGVRQVNGRGMERDVAGALENFRRAADAGNNAALFNMGFMYLTGTGVEMDREEAVRYFNESANLGNAAAYNGLGILYFSGDVYPKDYEKARYYFEKASDLGSNDSTYNLGLIHKLGLGTEENLEEALEYFNAAYETGHWKAANMVGQAHFSGLGTPIDLRRARDYFQTSVHDTARWTDIINEATAKLDAGHVWPALIHNIVLSVQGSKLGSINTAWILKKYRGMWATAGFDWEHLAASRLEIAAQLGSKEARIDHAMLIERSDAPRALELLRVAAEEKQNCEAVIEYGLMLGRSDRSIEAMETLKDAGDVACHEEDLVLALTHIAIHVLGLVTAVSGVIKALPPGAAEELQTALMPVALASTLVVLVAVRRWRRSGHLNGGGEDAASS